jgi:hypothetical protein
MALAQSYGTSVRIIGTPWSAPAWAKNSGAFNNGTLLDDLYGWYAKCQQHTAAALHSPSPRLDSTRANSLLLSVLRGEQT